MRSKNAQPPTRSHLHQASIDALEPRRLLAFSISGTTGNDLIEVLPGTAQFTLEIFINGQLAGTSGDNDIRVSGLGGNDEFVMPAMPSAFGGIFDIKFIGGPGDDVYRLGAGEFTATDFFGIVRIQEQAGEGNDSLFIDHTATVTPQNSTSIKSDRIGDAAFFDDNLELKQIDCGDGNDNVSVDGVPTGFRLNLANGTNTVTYGGAAKKINGDLAASEINGGAGTDKAVFDDSGGDTNVNRDYPISATGILNQSLIGFEQAELRTRRNLTGTPNSILMSGTGGVSGSIKFTGTSLEANDTAPHVSIGTQTSPIDWDNFSVQINAEFQSIKQIQYKVWDNDADQSGNPMIFDADSTRQVVQKGSMIARLNNGSTLQLEVFGGGSNDVFHIKDVLPLSRVFVNGGGGGDSLLTISDTTHGNAPEQVFLGSIFVYDGDAGSDVVALDDRLAAFPGGVDEYQISTGFVKNGVQRMTHVNVERVDFIAGGETNIIRIDTRDLPGDPLDKFYSIDARSGNDTITNFVPGLDAGALGASIGMSLLGGTGNDTLVIDDSLAESLTSQYALDTTSFSYSGVGSGTWDFGTSIESIVLVENARAANTELRGKRAGVTLDFFAGEGNDTVFLGGGDIANSGLFSNITTVAGGGGNDSIIFDDQLSTAGKTYTFDNFMLTAGGVSLLYGGFESQTLSASTSAFLFTSNTVNINATSSQISSTTINGGANRSCTVNVSTNNLVNVAGNLAVNLHNLPFDRLNVNDQLATGNDSYTLSATQLVKTRATGTTQMVIDYSGLSALVLNANQGINNITVNCLPANLPTTINDPTGQNSSYRLGGGNVGTNLLSPVTVNGPGGSSTGVVFENSSDAAPSTQTVNGGAITDGQTHNFSNVSTIFITNGNGGGTLDINRATIQFLADAFNQVVTIGNGNLDTNLLAPVTINGAASVTVDDRNDTGNDTYIVDAIQNNNVFFRKGTPAGPTVSINGGVATLQCNPFDNVITVNKVATSTAQVFGNGGNDRFDVLSTRFDFLSPVHTLGIDTGAENAAVSPFGDVANIGGTSRVQLLNHDTIRSLSVSGSARFIVPTAVVCRAQGISLTGVIDLAGGALLSPAGGPTPAQFRSQIISGRNGGAWNGTSASGAINSSLAAASPQSDGVGYGQGSEVAPTSIGGFAIAPGDTLLHYALDGDADLSGGVNIGDFSRIAANFNGTNKVWTTGDSNYDNATNIADFAPLAANFNQSSPAQRGRSELAAISTSPLGARRNNAVTSRKFAWSFGMTPVATSERLATGLWRTQSHLELSCTTLRLDAPPIVMWRNGRSLV